MENKKHILFISSWYPNRNDPTHGIFNRYFAEAASRFNRISVLHVSSVEDPGERFRFEEANEKNIFTLTVYYKKITSGLPLISQLQKKRWVLQAFEAGYEKLRRKAGVPDLIQLNVVMPMGIAAHHLSEKYGIPYVVNEGWSGYCAEDGNYKGFLKKFYTKRIIKQARAIMPVSDYLKKAMLSHGLKGNYFVVPNVVDVNRFQPLNNLSEEAGTFVHISSLNDREKNVSGLLRAFAATLTRNSKLKLNIVGEGVDKEKYEALVTELKMNANVMFNGRLLAEDLVNAINKSVALIMFSNYETFSLVIIEAFACGKPVITSNAGAVNDYMLPELGIVVNKKDEAALADAILDLAEKRKSYNADTIRQFAVKNYSYEAIGEKLNQVYLFALSKKN
jgi:glycosyltransferase involved in cell wall biosynthesis